MIELLNYDTNPILYKISDSISTNALNMSNLYVLNAEKNSNFEVLDSKQVVTHDEKGDLLIPMINNFNNFNYTTNEGWNNFQSTATEPNVTEISKLKILYPYTQDFTIEFSHLINSARWGYDYAKWTSWLFAYTTQITGENIYCFSHGDLYNGQIMYMYFTAPKLFNPTSFGVQSYPAYGRAIDYTDFAIYNNDDWEQIQSSSTTVGGSEITYFDLSTSIWSNKFRVGVRYSPGVINICKLRIYGTYQSPLHFYSTPLQSGSYLS